MLLKTCPSAGLAELGVQSAAPADPPQRPLSPHRAVRPQLRFRMWVTNLLYCSLKGVTEKKTLKYQSDIKSRTEVSTVGVTEKPEDLGCLWSRREVSALCSCQQRQGLFSFYCTSITVINVGFISQVTARTQGADWAGAGTRRWVHGRGSWHMVEPLGEPHKPEHPPGTGLVWAEQRGGMPIRSCSSGMW